MSIPWSKKLFTKNKQEKEENKKEIQNNENKEKTVITIGRELGSGGRKIAKKVAEKLNYEYYDKEIITKAAKKSGIDKKLFSQVDEADLDSFWFEFSKKAYDKDEKKASFKEITAADKLFMIQSDTIREVAKNKGVVIVGRCATYILKNESKKIFICANEKERVERIRRLYKVTTEEAKDIMKKSDKKRENYHEYYTHQNWKEKTNYDLYINTSEIGIENAVKQIIDFVEENK